MFNFRKINLLKAITRFPFASVLAIIATVLMMYVIDSNNPPAYLVNTIITCGIGALCNIALTVASEAHNLQPSKQWLGRLGIGLAMAVLYFGLLPESYDSVHTSFFRLPFQIASIVLFLHLLIAYIPFINKGSEEDFWEYNKDVFLNLVESVFYAFFLFAGLSIALLALDKLFGINLDGLAYPRLFFFLTGIFQTLYFLSKYPTVYYDNQIKTPIKAFLIFGQYILIPLVLVYMAILYAYSAQIAIRWELPKGWVSQLSLWFSVVGIFAYLLNYFNHKFSDFKLTAYFKKYFFLVLLLPIALVFVAICRRISEYGVTELRYVVALLGVWLLGVALYFNLSREKNIKVIPMSLSLVVLVPILLGPFNMFNATLASQKKHFKKLLIEKACLVNQELKPLINDKSPREFNAETASEVINNYTEDNRLLNKAIRYLDERSDLSFINEWVEPDLAFITEDDPRMKTDTLDRYHNARILAKKLNISFQVPKAVIRPKGERLSFHQDNRQSVALDSNTYFVQLDVHSDRKSNQGFYFELNEDKTDLNLYKDGKLLGPMNLEKYTLPLVAKQELSDKASFNFPIENPTHNVLTETLSANLIINNLGGTKVSEDNFVIDNIWGHAIIELKPTKE